MTPSPDPRSEGREAAEKAYLVYEQNEDITEEFDADPIYDAFMHGYAAAEAERATLVEAVRGLLEAADATKTVASQINGWTRRGSPLWRQLDEANKTVDAALDGLRSALVSAPATEGAEQGEVE